MTATMSFRRLNRRGNDSYKTLGVLALLAFLPLNTSAQSASTPPALGPKPEAPATKSAQPTPKIEPIKIGDLTVSGSFRARLENWDWFDTPARDDSYTFGAMTLRLAIGQSKERFEWMVEGQSPVLLGLPTNAIAPPPLGPLGMGGAYFAANGGRNASAVFKQGFVRFRGIFSDTASSLKLGRFEFIDGLETTPDDATLAALKRARVAQRLIGSFGFTHVTRSFDGLHYAHQTKASNFTFFAARPTSGAFDLNANKELDIDLYYGSFTKPLKFKSGAGEYRLFTMHYHDGRRVLKSDNRAAALRAADLGKIRMTTFGGNFIGAYEIGGGKTDVMLWGAGQFGNWGNLDHRAGAIAIELGYQPGGRIAEKIKPWIRGGYFRSTGDGDPTDAMHGTFFINSLAQPYARFPFFNLMNNEDSHAALLLKPHPKLALRAEIHYIRLSNARDLWYVGPGAFQNRTFGFSGIPANGGKSLGVFADISVDYAVTPRTLLTFYLGGVRGGSVMSNVHPLGGNGRFTYLEITQRF